MCLGLLRGQESIGDKTREYSTLFLLAARPWTGPFSFWPSNLLISKLEALASGRVMRTELQSSVSLVRTVSQLPLTM